MYIYIIFDVVMQISNGIKLNFKLIFFNINFHIKILRLITNSQF